MLKSAKSKPTAAMLTPQLKHRMISTPSIPAPSSEISILAPSSKNKPLGKQAPLCAIGLKFSMVSSSQYVVFRTQSAECHYRA